MEASLRLDSVASAGMGMSRSKMSAAIKSGLVLVNWKAATSGTTDVRMRMLLPLSSVDLDWVFAFFVTPLVLRARSCCSLYFLLYTAGFEMYSKQGKLQVFMFALF